MEELFKWLGNNPIATNTLIVAFGFIIISASLIYIVAFFQGKEISFWPPRIGSKESKRIESKNGAESAQEDNDISLFPSLISDLKRRKDRPEALIALEEFNKVQSIIKNASKGNDFIVEHIIDANIIALSSLERGQTFKGVSALISPKYWDFDKEGKKYKEINCSQAKKGVIIKRIFIFETSADFDKMRNILYEQKQNGIVVFYCFKKELEDLKYYSDFSILVDLNLALVVHREEKPQTVTITKNAELISELEYQFDGIFNRSKSFNSQKGDN